MHQRALAVIDLWTGGAAGITASTNGVGVDIGATYANVGRDEFKVIIGVMSFGGTNWTLDAAVHENTTSVTTGFTAISGATITQITTNSNAGSQTLHVSTNKRYIRVAWTVGGVSPAIVPFALAVLEKRAA